jgi:hypothetical protein
MAEPLINDVFIRCDLATAFSPLLPPLAPASPPQRAAERLRVVVD